jgi:serine/threonine-protein kinase
VQTYEVLSGGGQLAIAMEYLDGQPLTRVLNRLMRGSSSLSLPLRLRIVTSVLAGLEHAHTLTDLDGTPLEVVHRDVSPQNVFITYDGRVKLVDFGVAKTLAASHSTRPGAIKGKLAYMAPEQLQCAVVDRRADLFAVGVMLWEMLAGRRMWQGKTEVDIVSHLANGRQFPPLPLDASIPTGLDAICMRALDCDPAQRYQTAAEFEMELERVLVGVADSHARNLGKVVSLAFEAERAERQAVIERSLRGEGPLPSRMTPVTPMPVSRLTPVTPVTRVTPPAALAARSTRRGMTGIDITVGEFQVGPATSVVKRPSKPPPALKWWRAVALTSLAVTSFAAVLLLGLWRRAADDVYYLASPAGNGAGRVGGRFPIGAAGAGAAVTRGGRDRQRARRDGASSPSPAGRDVRRR